FVVAGASSRSIFSIFIEKRNARVAAKNTQEVFREFAVCMVPPETQCDLLLARMTRGLCRASFSRFQFRRAVGAKLIRLCDFLFAIRAGRVQIALAVRAKIEAWPDRRCAARAGIRQWLAHQQINN